MKKKVKYSSSNRAGHKPTNKELKYSAEAFRKKVDEYAILTIPELRALKVGGAYRDARDFVLNKKIYELAPKLTPEQILNLNKKPVRLDDIK